MNARFRPAQRLHKPADFSAVFGHKRVIRGVYLDLLNGQTTATSASARLGLVVPKRLARHAVLRNLIKRQAREIFRQCAGTLPAADLVIRLVRVPSPWPERRSEVKRLIRGDLQIVLNKLLVRTKSESIT